MESDEVKRELITVITQLIKQDRIIKKSKRMKLCCGNLVIVIIVIGVVSLIRGVIRRPTGGTSMICSGL